MKKKRYYPVLILISISIGIMLILFFPKGEKINNPNILKDKQCTDDSKAILSQDKTAFELKNEIAITSENFYISPIWSPDGKSILVSEIGYKGLYIIDVSSKDIRKLTDIQGAGYNPVWSPDSRQVFFRNKIVNSDYSSHLEVNSIDVMSGKIEVHPEINPDGLLSFFMSKENQSPIVYTNTETLLIEAQTPDKNKKWVITNEPGQYYQAILSPDKTKIVLHKEGFMYVYSIDGSGLLSSLGRGIACSWSADSKLILYFIGEDNGLEITGSELYICSSDGLNNWKLTNTPGVFEMFPNWSPDNKKIVYSDDKSGRIFIANLYQ